MNSIGALLDADDIELDIDVADKPALLRRVASLLSRRHGIPESQILENLVAREQLGSTGLGHGVAIPHARMASCDAAAGVLLRTRIGIAFDAPDGKPVSLFLGLIVPKQANERHLNLLATAAAMFSERAFRDRLRTSADRTAAKELLASWPNSSDTVGRTADASPASEDRGGPTG